MTTDPQSVSTPPRPAYPRRVPDYRYIRVEGYLADPRAPQPAGTVALHAWFNAASDVQRRFTTTLPAWSDPSTSRLPWRYVQLLGYVQQRATGGFSEAVALQT